MGNKVYYNRGFYYNSTFNVPKRYQQYIWAKSKLYHHLRREERAEIDDVIGKVCGQYGKEIMRILTTGDSVRLVGHDCHVSEGTLRIYLRQYYQEMYARMKRAEG